MRHTYYLSGAPILVMFLIASNVAVEFVLLAADQGWVGPANLRTLAYSDGAFWVAFLHGIQPNYVGQPVTMFFTYAFLHGGWLHLVVNMFALFGFGNAIVQRIGQKRFLWAYGICVLGGGVGFGLLSTSPQPMVGASGALFGLLGIWVCWDYLDRRHYGDSLWVTGRALLFLILYNVVFWLLLSGHLAWQTHLGGFVAGWLLAIYWGRGVHQQSYRRRYGTDAGNGGPARNANR